MLHNGFVSVVFSVLYSTDREGQKMTAEAQRYNIFQFARGIYIAENDFSIYSFSTSIVKSLCLLAEKQGKSLADNLDTPEVRSEYKVTSYLIVSHRRANTIIIVENFKSKLIYNYIM